VGGRRLTYGSAAYAGHIAAADAPVVARLREAGAIVIGMTATSEFATSSFPDTAICGLSRNPWNPERSPGGSSAGSAIAVATGCVPLCEGTDAGGSVRIPASLCGVVGMKPSWGRIPFSGPADFDTLWHHGPLARSVADAALFLSLTAGRAEEMLFSLPLPAPTPERRRIEGLRIGFSPNLSVFAVDPGIERAVRQAVGRLADAGAVVEEVALDWPEDIIDRFAIEYGAYYAAFHGEAVDGMGDQARAFTRELVSLGRTLSAVDVKRVAETRTALWRGLRPVFDRFDVLVCPTLALPAPSAAVDDFDFMGRAPDGKVVTFDLTLPFNLISPCPAISLPCGLGEDGMPVGLQIVGPPWRDGLVLGAALAIEAVLPGIGAPPLSAF
jgi:Asp-tRNA(Asn)/Glu-tRNA(Gln) amidotransferase A subunit family amidase